jgi:serine/threonine-protein kinase
MAVVYLARDLELDRPVAIKLLAENLAGEEGVRERFLREARLAARLSHPNVVRIYDAGEDPTPELVAQSHEVTRPFIVMEYVEGETLAAVLARRGRFEPAEAVELAAQACAGLEHAHRAGLVHRDVKPQNLLRARDGTLKLVDFGIARAAESTRVTEAGTVLGTAAYLAPEQAAGEEVGPAADVYSLGAVVYELLAGRPPFEFASLAELAAREDEAVVPVRDVVPNVSEHVEAVVMRCLAQRPEFRPRSAAELARELAAGSPEHPTIALPSRPERRSPRNSLLVIARWPVIGAAALATAAGVVGLVLAFSSGGGTKAQLPARVKPVPPAPSAQQYAKNYAAWIRANSR